MKIQIPFLETLKNKFNLFFKKSLPLLIFEFKNAFNLLYNFKNQN